MVHIKGRHSAKQCDLFNNSEIELKQHFSNEHASIPTSLSANTFATFNKPTKWWAAVRKRCVITQWFPEQHWGVLNIIFCVSGGARAEPLHVHCAVWGIKPLTPRTTTKPNLCIACNSSSICGHPVSYLSWVFHCVSLFYNASSCFFMGFKCAWNVFP